jgi:hypothetical protein
MDDVVEPTKMSFGTEEDTPNAPPVQMSFVEPNKYPLTDKDVQTRAAKADFALQEHSPGFDALSQGIANGEEESMRQTSAAALDLTKYNKSLETVKKVAGVVGRPLVPTEIDTVMRTAQGNSEPTDPETLWEKLYAVHYVKAATTDDPQHNFIFGKAMEKAPDQAFDALDRGSNTQAWREIVATRHQDLEARWDATSFMGKVGYSIKNMIPILQDYNLHNAVKEAPTNSFLPGSNLLEQAQYMMMLPVDKRAKVLKVVTDQLFEKSPLDAFKFMKVLNDYSSSDVFLHDILGVVDPLLMVLPIGGGIKAPTEAAAMAAVKAAEKAAGRALTADEIAQARAGTRSIIAQDQLDRTAKTARPLSIREIMAAKDGLGIEPRTGFMTPNEITRAAEGAPKGDLPVSQYTVNNQTYKNTDNVVFVRPEELDAKLSTSGDNPRRLFRDQSGGLAISERTPQGWRPTGARIVSSDEPEVGRVALNLGPERTSMGSKYYDQYRADGRVTDVNRVGTVTEPRMMSAQDIMRAREGVPWRLMDQDEIQLLRNSTASAIKAFNPMKPLDLPALTTSMGNIPNAAALTAVQMVARRLGGLDPLGEGVEFSKNIPSIMKGEQFYSGATRSLSQSLAETYANQALSLNEKFLNALINPNRAPRVDTPALQAAVEAAKKKWANDAYFKSDGMLEIEHIPANNVTNVDYVGFNFGKQNKTLFDTPQQAEFWAKNEYKFHEGDWVVRQEGSKFKITVPRPLDETDPTVFAKMIVTKHQETPVGLANMLFGYLRNSEDVLSEFNRATRHIVTHSPQELKSVLNEAAQGISGLKKKSLRELEDILAQNQKTLGPDGVPGVFYRDAAEFEEAFLNRFNKLPTAEQVKGYDTYVRLNEFDGMLRVLGWHRDMSRLGIVNYRFSLAKDGAAIRTDFIPGRPGKIDYAGQYDEGIYYYNSAEGTGQFVTKFSLKDSDKALRREIDDKVKNQGYVVTQLFSPNKKPLSSATGVDDVIHYVVTNGVEHKRLQWGQGVDWRPGGHLIYQDNWFIKQPLIRTGAKGLETYYGDATLRSGGNAELGAQALAKKYDDARQLLKAGDDQALDTYLRANLPESLSDFKQLFSGAGPGGGLSVDHPIVATYTGRNTFETNTLLAKEERYRGLREQATHPSNLEAALDKKFLAERGPILSRVADVGTEANPAFKLEPSRLVDPYTGLNMALGNAIRSRFFTDYKQSVAAHWVSEFSDVIKGGMKNKDMLERNPVYALYHAELDQAVVPRERYQAAAAVRDRALMLLGQRTELGASINRLEQSVMNSIYKVGGDEAVDRVTPTMIAAIKDPATYVRAMAFHEKLGFFNPVQLLVQAQTMFHSMAIAPRSAIPAMSAWFLSQRLRMTESEEILNYIAKKAPGWTPEDFKEAYQAMKNSGISHVGGETAWKDDMFDPGVFTGTMGRWLDKGLVFFKEGERATREVAWFSAYHEWKRLNPGLSPDQRAIGDIMNRWQTMTGDMTRASNAGWQKGFMTIPSQFLTFNIRMMEQLMPGLSSRLTPMEKLRVISTYSMLYGIPVGLSTMTGFYPAYDDMRKYAVEHQIDVHENWFKMAHEGLLSTLTSWATGRDYNVAQRLGPGANNLLVEVLKGNKDLVPLIAGPAGGVVADMAKTTVPFVRSLWYSTMGGDDKQYPITIEDFKGILQSENISAIKAGGRMLIGLNIGKYLDKNDGYVGDVTTMDSIFMGLGFTPQHIVDAQFGVAILADEKKMKDKIGKEVITEIQRGIQANADGDDARAGRHYQRARTLEQAAGFTLQDHGKFFNQATTGFESQIDRVNRRMLTSGDADRQRRILDRGQ